MTDDQQGNPNECQRPEDESAAETKIQGGASPAAASQNVVETPKTEKSKSGPDNYDKGEGSKTERYIFWDLLLTVILAIFTGLQAWFINQQLGVMSRQSDLMADQLEQMCGQNQIAIEQNKIAQGQLDQAAKAGIQTDRAIAQTEKVIEQMQIDSRPWLCVVSESSYNTKEDDPGAFGFTLRNSGKTPATIIEECSMAFYLSPGVRSPHVGLVVTHPETPGRAPDVDLNIDGILLSSKHAGCTREAGTVIGPDSQITRYGGTIRNRERDEAVGAGIAVNLVFVYVKYADTTGASHRTWSAFVYDPGNKTFSRDHKSDHVD